MNNIRPFVFGALATFAIAGALFGSRAIAQVPQPKAQSTHLIMIELENETHAIAADLIDSVYAFDIGESIYEVQIHSVSDFSGEPVEILKVNLTKAELNEFLKEANKYRN